MANSLRQLAVQATPTLVPLVFLLVAYNRIWSNTAPPWVSGEEELEQLKTFYPDRYEEALESKEAFQFSAFEYPSRVV